MEEELTPMERASLALGRFVNERAGGKRFQYLWNNEVGRRWVRLAIGPRVFVENIDVVVDRPPGPGGLLLALNHRSFFDFYITTFALYQCGAHWIKKAFFPVRSNFFYEHPLGVAVNVMLGGGSLYPPIFRDPAKAALTRDAVERMVRFLAEPDTMVGIHPEGTRNQDGDPYTLLPAQPGVGQIALQARPVIVPAFINGLGNSAREDIGATFRRDARRERPVIIVFGQPLAYDDLATQKPRVALYKRMADRMRDEITALGVREQALRAAAARGELDGSPGWVTERAPRW